MSVFTRDGYDNPFLGAVVRSSAGRDRKRVFIVTDVTMDGPVILLTLVNGSLRRAADGKRKNVKHVEVIGRLTDEEWREYLSSPDDGTVRRLIARYDGVSAQKTPEKEQSPNSGA